MRVAIDATSIRTSTTGVERVVLECTRALLEEVHSIEWHVYVRPHVAPVFQNLGAHIHSVGGLTRTSRIIWQQTMLPLLLRRLRTDLLLAPAYTAPLAAPCPVLLIVHDILAIQHPELCARLNVLHLRALMAQSVRRAECVVVPSRSVAEAVAGSLRLRREPMILEHGVSAEFLSGHVVQGEDSESGAPPRLPSRYLLTVGRIEARKNQVLVLEGLATLRRRGFDRLGLVVVGSRGPGAASFERVLLDSPVREQVRVLQNIRDRDLARLYAGAELLVYPSSAEGFGIPPLEALAMRIPVLVSRFTPSYVERWGEDSWVLPHLDPDTIASHIELILGGGDAGHATTRSQELQELTWKRHARILSEWILSLRRC